MKKKSAGLLLGLAGVSLLTVGFSAWIITGLAGSIDSTQVDVSVGQAINEKMALSAKVTDGQLSFDAITDDTTGPIIAQNSKGEDLIFKVEITIANALNGGDTNDFTDTFKKSKTLLSLTCDNAEGYNLAVSNGSYIQTPFQQLGTTKLEIPFGEKFKEASIVGDSKYNAPANDVLKTKYTLNQAGKNNRDLKVTAEFGFAWGTEFESKNPCLVADDQKAATYIQALSEKVYPLNAAKFTLHIEQAENISPAA